MNEASAKENCLNVLKFENATEVKRSTLTPYVVCLTLAISRARGLRERAKGVGFIAVLGADPRHKLLHTVSHVIDLINGVLTVLTVGRFVPQVEPGGNVLLVKLVVNLSRGRV